LENHEPGKKIKQMIFSIKDKLESLKNNPSMEKQKEICDDLKSILLLIPDSQWPKIDWATEVNTYTVVTPQKTEEEKRKIAAKTDKLPGISLSLFEYLTPNGLVASETIEPECWIKFINSHSNKPAISRFVPIYPGINLSENETIKYMDEIIRNLDAITAMKKFNYY